MNCEQAKKIKIADFLSNTGKNPARVYGEHAWYNSPLRTDKKPSFKVNLSKNSWFDIGTGQGGNILDLVMVMNATDLGGALAILERPELSKQSFSFSEKQKSSGIKIRHIQPLQNRALIEYLNSRNISTSIAALYVKEAYYTINKKQFFALAFKNDKGGYELRSSYFKGGNRPKYLTTIPGSSNSINIFEGFIDFLSALTFYDTSNPKNTTIILNTVENLRYAEQIIKSASMVNAYLDNDLSGEKALKRINLLNPNTINHAKIIYPGSNDFNDFVCNEKQKN